MSGIVTNAVQIGTICGSRAKKEDHRPFVSVTKYVGMNVAKRRIGARNGTIIQTEFVVTRR